MAFNRPKARSYNRVGPFLLTAALALVLPGIVYDNTTTDTLNTIVYSAGPYDQIGDHVTLAGTDRSLTSATVQFFNDGNPGSFDAILRFWNPGAPVGTQIGGDYQVTGVDIENDVELNVSFSLPDLSVPESLIATVQILNVSDGTDPGLDLFDPPTVGSSDNNSFIVESDGSFQTASTGLGIDNLYLSLDATTVDTAAPEPSTAAMMGSILILAAFARQSRRRARALPISQVQPGL
jgi:hypothetical protein